MSDIQNEKKPPSFGVLSICLPLIGIPLAYASTKPTEAGSGWGGAMQLVVIVSIILLCGIVSAIIGLNRSEKYAGLSLFGLVLNVLPIILVLSKH
jgi:hypothetical protein